MRSEHLEVECRYREQLEKQNIEVHNLRREASMPIPPDLDYKLVKSLSNEERDKLAAARPQTLGDVTRIPGVTPNAMLVLHAWCRRYAIDQANASADSAAAAGLRVPRRKQAATTRPAGAADGATTSPPGFIANQAAAASSSSRPSA